MVQDNQIGGVDRPLGPTLPSLREYLEMVWGEINFSQEYFAEEFTRIANQTNRLRGVRVIGSLDEEDEEKILKLQGDYSEAQVIIEDITSRDDIDKIEEKIRLDNLGEEDSNVYTQSQEKAEGSLR